MVFAVVAGCIHGKAWLDGDVAASIAESPVDSPRDLGLGQFCLSARAKSSGQTTLEIQWVRLAVR